MEPCTDFWTDGEEDNLLAQELLANHAARALAGGRSGGFRRGVQAASGDLQAGNAFIAGDRWRIARAHGIEEGDQFGAQRLVMTDRKMAHRVAAIGLEAETFGDLAREQIA